MHCSAPSSPGCYKSSLWWRRGTIYVCSATPGGGGGQAISHGLRQLVTTSGLWTARRRKEGAGWGRGVEARVLPFKDMPRSCTHHFCAHPIGQNLAVWPKRSGKERLYSGKSCFQPKSNDCGGREGECGDKSQFCHMDIQSSSI